MIVITVGFSKRGIFDILQNRRIFNLFFFSLIFIFFIFLSFYRCLFFYFLAKVSVYYISLLLATVQRLNLYSECSPILVRYFLSSVYKYLHTVTACGSKSCCIYTYYKASWQENGIFQILK